MLSEWSLTRYDHMTKYGQGKSLISITVGVNRLAKLGSGGRRNDSVCLEAVCFAAERSLPRLQE
jgi:hypothetical protein